MVSSVTTVAFQGIRVLKIDVQVQIRPTQLPAFSIVGLPDKAVAESRERVHAALHALGLTLPPKRIIVNLAPADLQKEGSHYDVPIAMALLGAMEIIPQEEVFQCVALGELGLDGRLRRVSGLLPTALEAAQSGLNLVCPYEGAAEAAWVDGVQIIACPDLLSLVNYFKGAQVLPPPPFKVEETQKFTIDLHDIKGQETAKRALEIAAAGGHNMLMVGPPGSGKSMLAARLPTILPPLEPEEALELSTIYSVAGLLREGNLLRRRPFRDPHHSASLAAMVGGGTWAKPGEISLAHKGVLFLDELPEFSKPTLEALRQPLESGTTLVARANAHITYPAKFQLIAAMNPCRCGYLGDEKLSCSQAPRCGTAYQNRLSGPLLDRIDLHVEVAAVKPADLRHHSGGETSEVIAARVAEARARQRNRYRPRGFMVNAELAGATIEEIVMPTPEALQILQHAAETFHLSARGYYRVMKVARTIADLGFSALVEKNHIIEALSYRLLRF